MSADPPSLNPGRFRYFITGIELHPSITDPDCKICIKVYVDDELICSLPWLDNTQPLRWESLFFCDVSSRSRVALRLSRDVNRKHRSFHFPPYLISEVDEETGETTLEHPELIWIATIKSLTPSLAEQQFLDKLNSIHQIEGTYDSLKPEETAKYLFKTALKFASTVAEASPDGTGKLTFLLLVKIWELLDVQTHLCGTIQRLLQGLLRIQDVTEVLDQASSSMFIAAVNGSKEIINNILTLLEGISVCIVNRLSGSNTEDESRAEHHYDDQNVEVYLTRLEELQQTFHASWTTPRALCIESDDPPTKDVPFLTWQEAPALIEESTATKLPGKFRPVDPSGYDPDRACMGGTREAVLNRIITWTQNRNNSESLMWISGQVGMGKSSIANSLCHRLDGMRALVGSFFCQRGDPDAGDPLRLINNIVHTIALRFPSYAYEVSNAIRADRSLCTSHLELRYEGLIKKPMEKLKSLSIPTTLVLVVDDLDVCGENDSCGRILHKLYDMSRLVPWFKIVYTARPLGDIQAYSQDNFPDEPVIHLQTYEASRDIRAYIQSQLGMLSQKEQWPNGVMDNLCRMAQGVFLWAALAVKYIKKATLPALSRLRKLLDNRRTPVIEHFERLYSLVLKSILDDDDEETRDAYSRCIGAIIINSEHEPLAIPDLQYLLLVAGRIDEPTLDRIVKNLGPLLLTDGRYARFHHPSFRDYITDSARSGGFFIQLDQYEAEPATCCLKVMQQDLRFNICGLESSQLLNKQVPDLEARIRLRISPALKYACTHWIDHFVASPNQGLVAALKKLLEGPQLIYWIEVLSLLGRMEVAITGLAKLASVELSEFEDWSRIVSWITDAHRFIISFQDAIMASTPHLYISAFAFAPTKSLTAQRMRPHFPNTIKINKGAESDWHPCIKTVHHPHAIQSMSISPGGLQIVTGYRNGTLGLHDKHSGALVSNPDVSHTDSVTCVSFSPDGSLIASCSYDATIRVWEVRGRLNASRVLAGHSGSVHSAAFSPRSNVFASGSSDQTIRLWNSKSKRPVGEPTTGHLGRVTSVAFSPDGTKLVSGSWDKTIRLWSVDLGSLQLNVNPLVITGHSDSINCVVFSPDGSKVASGSEDKTIRMWDAQTGSSAKTSPVPARHLDAISSIAFSPSGRLMVSSSSDGAIQLWDAEILAAYSQPFSHSNAVNAVFFSPDGAYIISGSIDRTTRVWKVGTSSQPIAVPSPTDPHAITYCPDPWVGHSSNIYSLTITADGTRIVSGSGDKTIRTWDPRTGTQIHDPYVGHSKDVNSVAVSPDGAYIVSVSSDRFMKLWNTTTHTTIKSYQHQSMIRSVALSPDCNVIAFSTFDFEIVLWEFAGWKMVKGPLRGHSALVLCVAFSPDGTSVASCSGDYSIILWDIKAHQQLGSPLLGHKGCVRAIAFSPCGTRLVSGSDDKAVRLWDAKTRSTLLELTGHSTLVMCVAFSPDGSHIASGSFDKTVRLWSTETGQIIGQPLIGRSAYVRSLVFSPDGRYVVSCFDDNTIKAWKLGIPDPFTVVEQRHSPPEQKDGPPGDFCWPGSPHGSSAYPYHPGWVTHNEDSLAFWLPAHYQQLDQFLNTHIGSLCPQPILDYSNFVYGTDWTAVIGDSESH